MLPGVTHNVALYVPGRTTDVVTHAVAFPQVPCSKSVPSQSRVMVVIGASGKHGVGGQVLGQHKVQVGKQ